MEVHAHTHTPRKKWTHYFWEFLMLFLAVFCGFLAEYQLEHKIEKDRERQFLSSLLEDLKADIKNLEINYQHHQACIILMDSLFLLLDNPQIAKQRGDDLYYFARVGPRFVSFANNSKTFDQLKNSGGFRLISNSNVADKIMTYYLQIPLYRQYEDIYNREFEDYKRTATKIIDPAIFKKQEFGNRIIVRGNSNPVLRSYEPGLLKEMGLWTIYLNGTRKAILQQNDLLKSYANELISFIKKEYQLK
jgi:hypothetical protein